MTRIPVAPLLAMPSAARRSLKRCGRIACRRRVAQTTRTLPEEPLLACGERPDLADQGTTDSAPNAAKRASCENTPDPLASPPRATAPGAAHGHRHLASGIDDDLA